MHLCTLILAKCGSGEEPQPTTRACLLHNASGVLPITLVDHGAFIELPNPMQIFRMCPSSISLGMPRY